MSSATAAALGRLDGVGDDEQAARLPSQPTATTVWPVACASLRAASSSGGRLLRPSRRAGDGRPTTTRVAVDDALDAEALAVARTTRRRRQRRRLRARAASAIGARDRVLGGVLDARRPGAAASPRSRPSRGDDVDAAPCAGRHGAGLVEHDRVDAPRRLQHLGSLDQDAELGAAAGADEQRRRRREAERAGAGDDQHGDGGGEREGRARRRRRARSRAWRRRARSRRARRRPATRSASRCTGALPVCASVTSRAIWASAVSAPTLVARTTRRPPTLTVAPTTSSPGPPRRARDSPVSSAWSTAERPSSTMPSVATFSPGRTTKRSPTCELADRDAPLAAVGVEHGDVLGAELQQRRERGAGAALRARLEVAPGAGSGS